MQDVLLYGELANKQNFKLQNPNSTFIENDTHFVSLTRTKSPDTLYYTGNKIEQEYTNHDTGETETALYIRSRFDKLGIPAYFSPEDAARAMAALVNYGLYLKKNGRFEQYLTTFFKKLQRKMW